VPLIREIKVNGRRTILIITMTDRSDADMRVAASHLHEVISRQLTPFSVVMDLRRLTALPASQRKMYADGREKLREIFDKHHRLTVYVVSDDRQRGLLVAIGWRAAPAIGAGRIFVSSWDEAVHLCEQSLLSDL
jgi:hypothetical protein